MHVEKALVALLEGHEPPPPFVKSTTTGSDAANAENDESKTKPIPKPQRKKGETRVLLPLSVLEEAVFGSRSDPERAFGRRKNRAFRGVREDGEWRSVDMEDDDSEDGDGTTYTKRPEPISTWEGAEEHEGCVDLYGSVWWCSCACSTLISSKCGVAAAARETLVTLRTLALS